MDISPAGGWIPPWLVLGLALVLAAVLAGAGAWLVLRDRRSRRRPPAEPLPGYGDDDLPGFLASPPGSASDRPGTPARGWPALAGGTDPVAGAPAPEGAGARGRMTVVVAAGALAALLVVAAVLSLLPRPGSPGPGRAGGHHDREVVALPPAPDAPAPGRPGAGELADASVRPGRDGGAARLEFGGLVLEQRAVGVTVAYPVLEGTWNAEQGVAHVRLPTFNCLSASAPEDPVAAGCVATVPEYADLPTPALTVTGDDGTVRLSGRFPTYLRPNGSPPVWTGRVYEFEVRAAPVDGEPAEGWVRATGHIRLGSGQAPTLDSPDVTVLRRD